jgi:hypothetical protein
MMCPTASVARARDAGSWIRYFATIHRQVTARIADGMTSRIGDDPAHMERFGGRVRQALCHGARCPPEWRRHHHRFLRRRLPGRRVRVWTESSSQYFGAFGSVSRRSSGRGCRWDLRLRVHVDYVQSVPAGQVELHVQDGPLDTYGDDAVH